MKDHEKRELVDRLTKLAQEFADTQQLRARIAGEVLPAIEQAQAAERERISLRWDGRYWDGTGECCVDIGAAIRVGA